MGGGLGHITRSLAAITSWQIEEYRLFTNCRLVSEILPPDKYVFISESHDATPKALFAKLKSTIINYSVDKLIIDVFPNGILGEIQGDELRGIGVQQIELIHRHMVWENYASKLSVYAIDTIWVTEEKIPEQLSHIKIFSANFEYLQLNYPLPNPISIQNKIIDLFPSEKNKSPLWVITHTSKQDEIDALIAQAMDWADIENVSPKLLVISDLVIQDNNGIRFVKHYPACDVFPLADKIFTGCGFNSMYQLAKFREKHIFIPFPRKYDDQFARAKSHSSIHNRDN